MTERVFQVLEDAVAASEHQSRLLYTTFSFILKIFEKLKQFYCSQMEQKNELMSSIAAAMLQKLKQFSELVNKRTTMSAGGIDPRFRINVLNDVHMSGALVTLIGSSENETACSRLPPKQSSSEKIMVEKSIDLDEIDEIARFTGTTMTSDKRKKLVLSGNGTSDRILDIAQAYQLVKAGQGTLVASGSAFSISVTVIDAER